MPATKKTRHGFAQTAELVSRRVQFAASGAAGAHADQKARVHRTGQTNRIGSRSAWVRAAVRHEFS
ncbi:hypothetical protein [Arthrobacter sp. HMWF013]|uniref:hypothetical protein n=1 Tax=Arthrobacter sp. HMWF013 TaxID=2056849 RepID=UPI000D350260|nr:hypothetical protein [Arthrobacter sp. HMWF013]PTT70186.1 hypothetical protein DBR22_01840 [Arthrobacter sp. HMWF013]